MKKILVLILFLFITFGISVGAEAGDAILSWDAPTINEDGTSPAVVTGYKVYSRMGATYATSATVGDVLTYTLTGLPAGTWYFVVTAYNDAGESVFSNEVSKAIPQAKPSAPTGCRVQ